jgi:murein DD-endopeptidase MepM/ murein hydrolase activator NlpD
VGTMQPRSLVSFALLIAGGCGTQAHPHAQPAPTSVIAFPHVQPALPPAPTLAEQPPAALSAPSNTLAQADSGGAFSGPLRNCALRSPLPGGLLAGYQGDTGLDIAANRQPVYAIASGTLEYSERGHTLWSDGHDTPNSVRIRLDTPIAWQGHLVTHAYYTHLSELRYAQAEGSETPAHVRAGELLGKSGIGRGMPHLHLGLLLDGQVDQASWSSLLREDQVRVVLGGYATHARLP